MSIRPNCAVAVSQHHDTAETYDAKVDRLKDVYVSPRLKVPAVTMLGAKQKKLRLVRGVPQRHQLRLRNTGGYRATNVKITGKGKGVRVKTRKVGRIEAGETLVPYVDITLKSKQRRTKVRLKVSGSGSTATVVLPVQRVQPPPRPKAGRWSGHQFSFRVRNGRITAFRGTSLRMECRTPGQYPTYRNVSLTFPTVKVPRHGYVQASAGQRTGSSAWAAQLHGRIVGKKLTRATFTYATGNCWVREAVRATPRGR
jgi:hypothetical protein